MPRKTKDTNELSEKIEKKATSKKTEVKKAASTAKKSTSTKKTSTAAKKTTTTKKTTAKATTKVKEVTKAADSSPAEKEPKKVSPKKTSKKAEPTSKEVKEKATKKATKAIAVKEEKTKALTTAKKTTKAVAVKKEKTKALTTTKKSTKAVTVKEKKTKALTTTKKATKKTTVKDSDELTVTDKLKALYTEDEKNRKETVEYYDLPYNYNETVVKILAQTPKKLFVYWDVSINDVENFKKVFGENFFNETYPVLIVHNEDQNYSFEIKINDFANSWYIDIENTKCKYSIDYGRKFKKKAEIKDQKEFSESHITLQNDYLFISNSNKIESPNDHILFEKYTMNSNIRYKNVKTNEITTKKLNKLPVFKIIKNIYSAESGLESLYNSLYGLNGLPMKAFFDLGNPSSGNPSSGNPTSRFVD